MATTMRLAVATSRDLLSRVLRLPARRLTSEIFGPIGRSCFYPFFLSLSLFLPLFLSLSLSLSSALVLSLVSLLPLTWSSSPLVPVELMARLVPPPLSPPLPLMPPLMPCWPSLVPWPICAASLFTKPSVTSSPAGGSAAGSTPASIRESVVALLAAAPAWGQETSGTLLAQAHEGSYATTPASATSEQSYSKENASKMNL